MNAADANFCNERHKAIDEKFIRGEEHFNRMEEKQDRFLWALVAAMGAILLSIFVFALSIRSEIRSDGYVGSHSSVVLNSETQRK